MSESLAKQVETTLNINSTSTESNSTTTSAAMRTNISDKEHADEVEAEAVASEADSESAEDARTIELRGKLEEATADLASLPKGHPSTSEKLSYLADCKVKYHHAVDTMTDGPFLEAFQIATQARDHPAADAFAQSLAMYMQMVCCYSLYNVTKQVTWLRESVAFGAEGINRMKDAEYGKPGQAYSARCEHLAGILEKLYEVEGLAKDIASAAAFQRKSVDNTFPEQYPDDSGDFTLYCRHKQWVALCIKKLDKKPNLMVSSIESLITQASKVRPCALEKDGYTDAHIYWFVRFGLYCRLWATSKTPEHLKLLRQRTRELLEWEADDPFCPCHGNKDDPSFSTDPQNPLHVIRRAAGFFDEWFDLDNAASEWSKHLATINTSISLWEETEKGTSRLTFADLQRDLRLTITLQERYRQRYSITRAPRDGWQVDDKTWEISCINLLVSTAERRQLPPSDSIQPFLDGSRRVTFGASHVAPELFSVHSVLEVGKPWDLKAQRFKFIDGDTPLAERWIRQRSDNGKFVLGEARKGRDDDVLEFIANYNKPIATKP